MTTAAPGPDDPRRESVHLAMLFAVLYFVQGVGEPVAGLVAQPVRSILRSWGEDAATIAAFSAAVSIPWTLKPLYGLISDFVPFFGYRRKSYLLATGLLCAAGFLALFWFRPQPGNYAWFLMLLVVPTVAIAFSDVVVDALMIEKGQPRGLTGVFQSVQWAATYAAVLLTGVLGGYLSQHGLQYHGFLLCGVLGLVTVLMSWRYVDEERHGSAETFRDTLAALRQAARSPALLAVAGFLFLWSLDPLSTTLVYLQVTEEMGLSEQFFGWTLSILAAGCIAAAIGYGFVSRRFSMLTLAHAAIVLGAASQAMYWTMSGVKSAVVVHFFVGVTYMTALLIQLDLAARVCPPHAAATVFAVIMALTNLASSLGEWLGGSWYQRLLESSGGEVAFDAMVGLGTFAKLTCWALFFLVPARLSLGRLMPR